MYIFNRVTVVPQLPQRINKLAEIANNLWWSWNTEYLRLFEVMDPDLWDVSERNPVKFLKMISQEIVLGMAGVKALKTLGYNPTVYHMNEGHSSFLTLELIKNIMEEKQISFEMAREIATVQTVFTTHTPVPAGNDIFEIPLVEKYFNGYWDKLGIQKKNS